MGDTLPRNVLINYLNLSMPIRSIKITNTYSEFEREPLARPFGFKGGYLKEIWQAAVLMESDDHYGTGLGSQSVLWSEPRVFAKASESGGNSLMFAITDRALQMVKGESFGTPMELLDRILPELYSYAKDITGLKDLSKTFVLNALVSFDNAAWVLYAREHGIDNFDGLIPDVCRPALRARQKRISSVPIASYNSDPADVERLITEEGYFVIKFKLGAPGSQQEMLEQDMAALERVHERVGDVEVAHTEDGRLPYYLDPNGRYESMETLQRLLDHADRIGMLDQILILEEPFPEQLKIDVGDLGVTVAADESAHTAENVRERIDMGYGAIALKPIAKTLSMTFKMVQAAYENDIPCFCADLTVNPILNDWNKNIASRLETFPRLKETGLIEVNGHQNYRDWTRMQSYHPTPEARWQHPEKGMFILDDDFYEQSGGVLQDSDHYLELLSAGRKGGA